MAEILLPKQIFRNGSLEALKQTREFDKKMLLADNHALRYSNFNLLFYGRSVFVSGISIAQCKLRLISKIHTAVRFHKILAFCSKVNAPLVIHRFSSFIESAS